MVINIRIHPSLKMASWALLLSTALSHSLMAANTEIEGYEEPPSPPIRADNPDEQLDHWQQSTNPFVYEHLIQEYGELLEKIQKLPTFTQLNQLEHELKQAKAVHAHYGDTDSKTTAYRMRMMSIAKITQELEALSEQHSAAVKPYLPKLRDLHDKYPWLTQEYKQREELKKKPVP